MSAVNIYRLHDRVVIHTDAAAYTTDDNVVIGSALKVITFPAQAMAVAVRGPAALSAHIATSLVAQFKNIAEARQGDSYFKAMVPALKEFGEMYMTVPGHADFQAFLPLSSPHGAMVSAISCNPSSSAPRMGSRNGKASPRRLTGVGPKMG